MSRERLEQSLREHAYFLQRTGNPRLIDEAMELHRKLDDGDIGEYIRRQEMIRDTLRKMGWLNDGSYTNSEAVGREGTGMEDTLQ